MVTLRPFNALRYDPAVAGPAAETSAPPYSDLDPFDYAGHRTTNPYTVLELMTPDQGTTALRRHTLARDTLRRWIATGVLQRDPQPSLSVLEQVTPDGHVQRGIVGAMDVADGGSLLLHEHVDEARAAVRAARLEEVPVDLTPVLAVHLGAAPAVGEAVRRCIARPPTVSLVDRSGIRHTVWTMSDPSDQAAVVAGLAPVPVVLADGHHRVAAARRRVGGGGPTDTLAMVLDVHDAGPRLRAVHRAVRCSRPDVPDRLAALEGVSVSSWAGDASALDDHVEGAADLRFGIVTPVGAWVVAVDLGPHQQHLAGLGVPPVLQVLDVVALQEVLYPAMGAYDDEAVADVAVGLRRVHDGEADVLVLLAPPSIEQVLAVARAGERMPAKTTWFWPKPRAGLVMRHLDPPTD